MGIAAPMQQAVRRFIRRPARTERGATAVEYALIAVLIAVVIATAVGFLGETSRGLYECTKEAWDTGTDQC